MKEEWRSAVDRALKEPFDAVLKAFWLTRLVDGQDRALQVLERAYEERKKEAKRIRELAKDLPAGAGLQTGYVFLLSQAQAARLDTEAAMFKNLAEGLAKQRSEW